MCQDARSKLLRRLVIDSVATARQGHISPAFSIIEILRVLYDSFLHIDPTDPRTADRDRFLLSKGHGCLALYAILADKGFFSKSELSTFCQFGSRLGGHPEYPRLPGVEISSGSLGHGLPIGVGMALAGKIKCSSSRTVILIGDGELNEGSNWEAIMHATKHRLSNLTLIVDSNGSQCYGASSRVLELDPLATKLQSFGFAVEEIDGHDVNALEELFKRLPLCATKPSGIICRTVKGRGLGSLENDPSWHYRANLTDADLNQMITALETS